VSVEVLKSSSRRLYFFCLRSLGCTIIELLTGKPPYFDLTPFAAMYQIVQANHPPFPPDTSAELADFLLQCFQHNPAERASATQLLSHVWLEPSLKRLIGQHLSSVTPTPEISGVASGTSFESSRDEKVASNQQKARTSTKMESPRRRQRSPSKKSESVALSLEESSFMDGLDNREELLSALTAGTPNPVFEVSSPYRVSGRPTIRRSASLPALHSASLPTETPLRTEAPRMTTELNLSSISSERSSSSSPRRDGLALSSRSEDSGIEGIVASMSTQLVSEGHLSDDARELYHNTLINSSSSQDYNSEYDLHMESDESRASKHVPTVRINDHNESSMDLTPLLNDPVSLSKPPLPHGTGGGLGIAGMSLSIPAVVVSAMDKSPLSDAGNIMHSFASMNDVDMSQSKDTDHRRAQEMLKIMNKIRPGMEASDGLNLCSQLFAMCDTNSRQIDTFVHSIGVMPIIEMLEAQSTSGSAFLSSHESEVRRHVVRIINKIIESNYKVQEQLALMGIIPIMLKLFNSSTASPKSAAISPHHSVATSSSSGSGGGSSSSSYDSRRFKVNIVNPIVLEISRFVHMMALSSSLSTQMLIGSGGLPVFVDMISYSSLLQKKMQASLRMPETVYVDALHSAPPTPLVQTVPATPMFHSSSTASSGLSGVPTPLSGKALDILAAESHSPAWTQTLEQIAANDEIAMVYMGVDCVDRLFQFHTARTKDFARSLIKLGILTHLSIAFKHVFGQYLSVAVDWQAHLLTHKASFSSKALEPSASSSGSGHLDPRSSSRMDLAHESRSRSGTGLGHPPLPLASSSVTARLQDYADDSSAHAGSPFNNEQSTPLSSAAHCSVEYKYAYMIASLFVLFAKSDPSAAEKMAFCADFVSLVVSAFQSPIFRPLSSSSISIGQRNKQSHSLPQPLLDVVELLLTALRHITAEPAALSRLENSGILVCLVHLLNGPLHGHCENLVLQSIFNLCRLNRSRQERAAMHGIIPHLKRLIEEGSQFKQIALSIVLDMAHTSTATRLELWKHDMVPFYIHLLKDPFCQSSALNALAVW
jgi:serine/threonine protein kinase